MYIYLDDDLAELDLKNNPKLALKLSLLITSAVHGCNLLNAKKKTFKSLINSDGLSDIDKTHLEQILRFNFEYTDFFEKLTYKIIITNTKASVYKDEDSTTWYFPLEKIEYGYLDSVELLAEDLSDGELLLYAVKHYIKLNSIKRLGFNITPRNGGGANIAKNFKKSLEPQSNFVIAFCDSDKFSPQANFSEVTQKCHDIADEETSFGCFFHTDGREIENDIPLLFIENGHLQDPAVLKNISEISTLKGKLKTPFFKYVDLKEGLSPNWIAKLGKGSDCKIFWNRVVEELDALDPSFISSYKSPHRSHPNLLISQICSNMAVNVLKWLSHESKNHPKSPHQQLDTSDGLIWLDHGRKLFELGCAMPKIRL
ncbi:hypothetical protein M5F00_09180 [Acinetobacter sp. ANC 4945]|uniref:Uncharacterized protein n=1 Tax=Acinetobacter amyesii TaxID=2942470 RepID=A0A1T1GUJ5_9GAMM|nr:hypothetical protein [Acinetobacter amyesii]MCL6248033.1 hypothetical protein [Acinetobacter amyesii]OOV81238.1 hypothetical protein B1202_11825 [Acinetobacter amyesii]